MNTRVFSHNFVSSVKALHAVRLCSSNSAAWIRPTGHETEISVYNTLTQEKNKLILPKQDILKWYICGPTVYDESHIGHACTYTRFDIIRRILINYFNYQVVTAMSITDVDDKIIKRARWLNTDHSHVSKQYEANFLRDMAHLRIIAPTVLARVTEYIPDIIAYVQKIIDNGFAYITDTGTVYFDKEKFRKPQRLRAENIGARYHSDPAKKSPKDFALWKAAKPGEPFWEAPWGKGRPGWHIECSAMANTIFGRSIDLHSGARDLIFPHHECELAQAQAYANDDSEWVNYWLHTGYLMMPISSSSEEGEKMAKSLGNTITISELLSRATVNQFRMMCMMTHYRKNFVFDDQLLDRASQLCQKFLDFLGTAEDYVDGKLQGTVLDDCSTWHSLVETKDAVHAAFCDDFDFPTALNSLTKLIDNLNAQLLSGKNEIEHKRVARSLAPVAAIIAYYNKILRVFGLRLPTRQSLMRSDESSLLAQVLDGAIKFRNDIRVSALSGDVPRKEALKQESVMTIHRETADGEKEDITVEAWTTQMSDDNAEFKPVRAKRGALLTACDNFRDTLAVAGIQIKDRGRDSSWIKIESSKSTDLIRKKDHLSKDISTARKYSELLDL